MPPDREVALITGAGSGIGQALAVDAARRGLAVILTGRHAAPLEATRSLLEPGTPCLLAPGDVTCGDDRLALRERVRRWSGRLDFLVNNAGVLWAGPLAAMSDADMVRMMTTNLVAPLALTRDLLPLLMAAGRGRPGAGRKGAGQVAAGRVVNVGSMFGDIPYPLFTAYSASKHGVRGLSGALRRELRDLGVGVTYAAPRGARTPASAAIEFLVQPLGMRLDPPGDIARRIWDGVLRGADTVYPCGPEWLFAVIERLCPGIIDAAVRRQLRQGKLDSLIRPAPLPPQSPTPRTHPV